MEFLGLTIEEEITDLIEWLSKYSEAQNNGVTRLLYTEEWIEAQIGLKKILEDKGFSTYFDEIGNLFGRLEGSNYKDETILTGSHVDTVINGGRLDGQFGIIAGIIAMNYLKVKYGQPLRNIEVVSMAEEEGSRFPFTFWGSKNIVGTVENDVMKNLKDAKGVSFSEAMNNAGFDFKSEDTNMRKDLKAFIELHIEQGGVLEKQNIPIGIVEHIVGQNRYMIEVEGEANHAGTTPMGDRRDALLGVSKMINEIMQTAVKYGDPLVATVGKIDVIPNTTNVIPGKVKFSLDVRHTQKDIMVKFMEEIILRLNDISNKMDLSINFDQYMFGEPVAMDSNLVKIVSSRCLENSLKYKLMHSGAGHDAQIFAKYIPTVLMFVPSHKGISHNPDEFTETRDLAEGVKALIETLYYLAY